MQRRVSVIDGNRMADNLIVSPLFLLRHFKEIEHQGFCWGSTYVMWKRFENVGLRMSKLIELRFYVLLNTE